ncbi:MAG: ABC transporter permease [Lachnospiraceae bacterium]|nr:ABC transporter permease [Lachnospiraceae bacterium]
MKLRKEEFKGTGQVYRFTLVQLLKSRTNLVSAIIMILFALFSIPVMTFINGDSEDDISSLHTVYYLNETSCPVDFGTLGETDPRFREVSPEQVPFAPENWQQQLVENEAFVHIFSDEETGGFSARIFCPAGGDEEEAEMLSEAVFELIQAGRYQSFGVSEEQISQLSSSYTTDVNTVENYQEAEAISADTSFAVQYIYAILVLILCTFSTTFIVRAIIEEKASRLVETLLISVRPLAMILGKILAVMTYVFGLVLLMIVGAVISWRITGIFMDGSVVKDMISGMGLTSDMLRFGPFTVAVVLISLILGYFTFSIIGGIAGTSCSSMEDVESANMSVLIFILGGYMVSCFTAAFGGMVGLVTSLIPIVSIFCAPVQYVLGNISMPVLCLAWLVQLILLIFLARFCAAVYGDLIMYRGSRLKFRNLITMARGKKRGGAVR